MTVAVPDPADGLRRLRRRPRQLVLPRSATSRSPPTPPPWPAPSGCPNLTKATDGRLRQPPGERHRRRTDCGDRRRFERRDRRGASTATVAPRVTVTDPNATRYFSQVFAAATSASPAAPRPSTTCPLPLGSPLNYFGGDASQTQPRPRADLARIDWPADYNRARPRRPTRRCNVGDRRRPGLRCAGRRHARYDAAGFSGSTRLPLRRSPRCDAVGHVRPSRRPTTTAAPARRRTSPATVQRRAPTNGRWDTGSPPTFTHRSAPRAPCTRQQLGAPGPSRLGRTADTCRGRVTPVEPAPAASAATMRRSAGRPVARAPAAPAEPLCGPRHAAATGSAGGHCARSRRHAADRRPNPIPTDRSPGFWAMIYGPGQYAANGDAFSARCTRRVNCSSVAERAVRRHRRRRPRLLVRRRRSRPACAGSSTSTCSTRRTTTTRPPTIVDSARRTAACRATDVTPTSRPSSGSTSRPTRWTSTSAPTLFDAATRHATTPPNGGCWWKLRKETAFNRAWAKLCTHHRSSSPATRYLVNVRTNAVGAANEAGNNGYAIEAVLNGEPVRHARPEHLRLRRHGHVQPQPCAAPACTLRRHLLPRQGRPAVRRPDPGDRDVRRGRRATGAGTPTCTR